MKYDELKSIAQPHVRNDDNLPSNAFLLLTQLHIPFKSKRQCEAEFGGKMNPLYNSPAFLSVDGDGGKVIYFNDSVKYWNFYIFHEVAHYLLGHESDSPQNEIDADLLACILAAPSENLPSTIKSARDLSVLCKIPIDKAEMYWAEIKDDFSAVGSAKNPWMFISFGCIAILVLCIIFSVFGYFTNKQSDGISEKSSVININQYQGDISDSSGIMKVVSEDISVGEGGYYITASGAKYHVEGCQYIRDKANLISVSLDEARKLSVEPCKKCIKQEKDYP